MTGGGGFIGSHIVTELVQREEKVRVLDNFSTGSRSNLDHVSAQCEVINGDLRDMSDVASAVGGVSHVLHLGALGSVPRSIDDPLLTHENNATGTLNLLRAAQMAGVSRVVFASSSSVYGDTEALPKVETMIPRPQSPYAASKMAGESYCRAFHSAFGMKTVVLRYFNVFGPGQTPDSQYAAVIPRFIAGMLAGEQPTIFGDGEHSRDFTYVANVVDGTLLARDAATAPGGTFNIACAGSHTIREVVEAINREIGSNLDPIYAPVRPGDVRDSYADISAAAEWGYAPSVDFDSGIAATVAHFANNARSSAR